MSIPQPYRQAVVLTAVSMAGVMFHLEISSVPVILSTLQAVLHGDFQAMQWVMNAYTIACTTVLMATGTLADRYGRKRLLLLSLALFGAASLMCGLAQSMPVLVVSRFLQGIGGGAMMICQIAVLSHQFPAGRERGRAFAVWGLVFGIGLGLGPLIAGLIVDLSDWRWIFLVQAPLTVLTMALVLGSVEESRDRQAKRIDLPGLLTLSLAVLGITWFITQGPRMGFGSGAGMGILLISAASFIAFVIIENQQRQPMFDFRILRIRPLSGALVGSIAMNVSFWPFNIYLPILFQGAFGYSATAAGGYLLAYTLPTLVMPPLAARLSLRHQPRLIIPLGLFAIGLGFFLMKAGSGMAHAGWLTMLPGCLLAGCGLGFVNTIVTSTITGSITSDRAGMAAGIDMSARLITFAVNIALMGLILSRGILSYLRSAWPGPLDTRELNALADHIATGSAATPDLQQLAHDALLHGFGAVMLYGGAGVWILAALSFAVFGPAPARAGAPGDAAPARE